MDLDSSHRTNIPGTSSGNWGWRYTEEMLDQVDKDRIKELVSNTNRK
jgi:4-alpha-glucanotransferase